MEADFWVRDTENGELFPAAILDGSIETHRGDAFATVIPVGEKGRGGVVELPDGYETRTGVVA